MTDFGYRCGLVFSKAMAGDEILLLDGWSPTPTALWRLKARGRID